MNHKQTDTETAHDVVGALIRLHVAEYEALMTRNNNWVAIQVGIWTVIILYLTAAVAAWTGLEQLRAAYGIYLVWGSGVIIQLVIGILCFTIAEVYRNAAYIETELRPLLSSLVHEKPFWGYESFISKGTAKWATDWSATLAFIAALLLTAFLRHAFTNRYEALGLASNVPFTAFLIWQTAATANIRKRLHGPVAKKSPRS